MVAGFHNNLFRMIRVGSDFLAVAAEPAFADDVDVDAPVSRLGRAAGSIARQLRLEPRRGEVEKGSYLDRQKSASSVEQVDR